MRQEIIDNLKKGVDPDVIARDALDNMFQETKRGLSELYYGDRVPDSVRTRQQPVDVRKFRGTNPLVTSTSNYEDTISVFIEFDGDNTPVSITLNPNVGGRECKTSKSIIGSDTLHIVSDKHGTLLITECMAKAMRCHNLNTTLTTLDV